MKKKKKIFLVATCAIMLAIAIILTMSGCSNSITAETETVETTEEDRLIDGLYEDGFYVRNCEIIAVENVEGNTAYTVEGRQHYLYAFYGIGYEVGDVAECVFWEGNDYTSRIDDELVDVWDVY